jgi:predicted DNA-binding transcriptional regulator YafY
LLILLHELAASSAGLTITEMMGKLGVSRRTIERMLATLQVYHGLHEERSQLDGDHHRTKRWRLKEPLPSVMQVLEPGERAALEIEAGRLPHGPARQGLLKLLGGLSKPGSGVAINTGTLIERTAYLGSVGPAQRVSEPLIATLERAIVGREVVRLTYRSEKQATPAERLVKPLGLLFSRFGYLVALDRGTTPKTYRLNSIVTAELTGELFPEVQRFNLKEWAAESFGIYHGDKRLRISLRFAPEVAERAMSVSFHPSEQKRLLKDGSLVVSLHCKGHRELFWELLHPDWIGRVTIESPAELADSFAEYLKKAVINNETD